MTSPGFGAAGGPPAAAASLERTMVHGVLAQFSGPADLLHAAEKVRDAGYRQFDCHSPFPIHGMDDAMGEKRSSLPWIVAAFALFGFIVALGLQTWSHVWAYPIVVSGKPLFSHMAFFPITFAGTVLFSVVATVAGMIYLIRQRFHHPVFYSNNFEKVTDDSFFVSILATDPQWNDKSTPEFLRSIGGVNIELLEER